MFLLKEVAALLIFDDLRSEGNRSLFEHHKLNYRKIWTFTTVTDPLQLLILLIVLIIVSQKNSFAA